MARAASDNLHSRLVNVLKLVLPLLALALLSTLFLFSRKIDPEAAIPYATVDVADRLRDPKMTDAGFASMTQDGSTLTLTAAQARPTATGGTMHDVFGTLTTVNGAVTHLTAAEALLNTAQNLLTLSGGTQLQSWAGYLIAASGFDVATDLTRVASTGPVTATGPLGDLNAQSMVLSQPAVGAPYLLVFKGKVRLIYKPKE
jgi:lipopolysaccharide export system protein LptC